MAESVFISSEEEAWNFLKKIVEENFVFKDGEKVFFGEWPHLKMYLPYEADSTISLSMLKGYSSLEENLFRSYLFMNTEELNLKGLSESEKQELQIHIKVTGGSSNYDVDLQKIFNRMVEKMKSHHIAISVVGCALLFCSKDIWIEFIKEKSQTQREEMMRIERTELGKQETERLKIMSNVINHYPAMNQIKELSEDSKMGLMKSIATVEKANLQGIDVSGKTAAEVISKQRVYAEDIRLDGVFKIVGSNVIEPKGFKINLRRLEDNLEFVAYVEDTLPSAQKAILEESYWKRNSVNLSINAKKLRDKIIDANIIEVTNTPKLSVQ